MAPVALEYFPFEEQIKTQLSTTTMNYSSGGYCFRQVKKQSTTAFVDGSPVGHDLHVEFEVAPVALEYFPAQENKSSAPKSQIEHMVEVEGVRVCG